jgi:hypothetical protein
MTSNPTIGEKIGRVSEYHVKSTVRIFAANYIHEFDTVGMIEPYAEFIVSEDASIGRILGTLPYHQGEKIVFSYFVIFHRRKYLLVSLEAQNLRAKPSARSQIEVRNQG